MSFLTINPPSIDIHIISTLSVSCTNMVTSLSCPYSTRDCRSVSNSYHNSDDPSPFDANPLNMSMLSYMSYLS